MRFSSRRIVLRHTAALLGLALVLRPDPARIAAQDRTCVSWLAYHTDQTGDWEIFRLGDLPDHPDAPANLSQGVGKRVYDVGPSLSPDGQWIAFASTRDGSWEIYIGAADGSEQRRVTTAPGAVNFDPAWSPTGEWIAYESARDGNWDVYMTDITTGIETRLTDWDESELHPSWSPDGAALLFQSDRGGYWQVYALDPAALAITRLSDGTGDDHDPAFSPDGSRIVFRSYRDGATSVIYTMNADGSGVTRISDPAGDAASAVWSAEGRLIAYQSDLDGDQDIYIYEPATGITRLVTANEVDDYAPTWRCDGPVVVFTSVLTGDANLFEAPALPVDAAPIRLETGARQLTFDPASEQYPVNTPPEETGSRQGRLPGPEKHK